MLLQVTGAMLTGERPGDSAREASGASLDQRQICEVHCTVETFVRCQPGDGCAADGRVARRRRARGAIAEGAKSNFSSVLSFVTSVCTALCIPGDGGSAHG